MEITSATTRGEATRLVRKALAEAGIESAALDARVLICAALRVSAVDLVTGSGKPVGEAAAQTVARYAARRVAREPIARILGEREFWGLSFALSPETLVPRPDSETVVETALALVESRSASSRILDLGTGSGCLVVALLHELPGAFGVGVDRSHAAAATARRNAWSNGVGERAAFLVASWTVSLTGSFDLIVSNPPYVATSVVAKLDQEVREHDPTLALDGGPDGLNAYRAILPQARPLLAPGGAMVLEIGFDQSQALRRLAGAHGLEVVREASDLSGRPRCVALKAT